MLETIYETDSAVSQYCEAHYGESYFGVANFPQRCAQICLEYMQERPTRSALDLGCAVGRATFELARHFDLVTGVDYSAHFIRVALGIRQTGVIQYDLTEEGEIISHHEKRLADFHLEDSKDKTEFFQADATNLGAHFGQYDLLFAGNLLDRLSNPASFLRKVHERIHAGGVLIITSPYTWLKQFTERKNWIGGFLRHGEPFSTLDGMKELLSENFRLLDEPRDVAFVLRETKRKFQHSIAQLTAWQPKSSRPSVNARLSLPSVGA